ncbi:MAG: hypothetical protein HYZ27_09095, partial [Deltaproteobacteria bacterium]|nr:hypothetical protein [Deltaproteobacteria bacterium]
VQERLAHSRQDGRLVSAIGAGILIAAALAAGASPALVLVAGAVGKAALGDPRDWASNAFEGGAMAMLATYAASLPPSVNLWLRSINEGLAAAVAGGFVGLQVGAGMGAVSWLRDGAPGFQSLFDRVMQGGTVGAVSGFVVGGALYYVQRAWNDLVRRPEGMQPAEGGHNRPPIENDAGGVVTPGNRQPINPGGSGGSGGSRVPIASDAGGASGSVTTNSAVWTQPGGMDALSMAYRNAIAANAPAPVLEFLWAARAQAAADWLKSGKALTGQSLSELLVDARKHGIDVPQAWALGGPSPTDLERLRGQAAQRAMGPTAR